MENLGSLAILMAFCVALHRYRDWPGAPQTIRDGERPARSTPSGRWSPSPTRYWFTRC